MDGGLLNLPLLKSFFCYDGSTRGVCTMSHFDRDCFVAGKSGRSNSRRATSARDCDQPVAHGQAPGNDVTKACHHQLPSRPAFVPGVVLTEKTLFQTCWLLCLAKVAECLFCRPRGDKTDRSGWIRSQANCIAHRVFCCFSHVTWS